MVRELITRTLTSLGCDIFIPVRENIILPIHVTVTGTSLDHTVDAPLDAPSLFQRGDS